MREFEQGDRGDRSRIAWLASDLASRFVIAASRCTPCVGDGSSERM